MHASTTQTTARAPRTEAWRQLLERAQTVALGHACWLETYGETSWDPHDLWANPAGRCAKAVYYRHRWLGLPVVAPLIALDTVLPGSRRLFWHRQRFAIADAHYAMGFYALAAKGPEWLPRANTFVEALVQERCAGEKEYCWGYPFDWETCYGTWPADTPLITSTPYAYEAFEAAYEATAEPRCLAVMKSIARFADTRIGTVEVAPSVMASAYTPYDSRRVVNASAYRGFLLATAGSRFGRLEWLAASRATLAFVLRSQRPDGSWLYAMDGRDAFVDNLHTCFVLKNLHKAWLALGDDDLRVAVDCGYDFYKSQLLDERGLPVPFARAQRPSLSRRELYDYAEGIDLGFLLADVDREALSIVKILLTEVLDNWVLADSHFVTRETVFGRSTIPYHRWAQAQMFRALARAAFSGAD